MITATFEPIMDGSTIVGQRLTLFFNGKYIRDNDFSAETTMTEDDINNYIAGKLSGLLA